MIDYIVLVGALPILTALAVCLVLKLRLTVLGVVGLGHLGNMSSSLIRWTTDIDPIRSIGLLDPILWLIGGHLVVLGMRLLWIRTVRTYGGGGGSRIS